MVPGSIDGRLTLLRAVPSMAHLPEAELRLVAMALEDEMVAAGGTIVREGEVGDRLYLLADGTAEVSVEGPLGRVLLDVYGPGEMFGEYALLQPGRSRSATVTATTECGLLTLDAEHFEHLLRGFPPVEDALQRLAADRQVATFLRVASPFAGIDRESMSLLIERLRPLEVEAGTDIMRQGERGESCFLLRAGTVSVLIDTGEGEREIAQVTSGTIIGEAALLTDSPRNATVRAMERCSLLVLGRDDLLTVLGQDSNAGKQVAELVQMRDRPRRADGIVVAQRTAADGAVITTLKDPRRAVYFRLAPEGYFLWERLDGNHTLRDLTLAYMIAFKAFAPHVIAETIGALVSRGFVETKGAVPADVARKDDEVRGFRRVTQQARRAVDWQVSLPNPDGWLGALYRTVVRPLYTVPGQVVLAILTVSGLVVLAMNLHQATAAAAGGGWLLTLLVVAYLVMVVLHELGHAITVKAFGYEVPRAGVGWYWFGPIAYADTSDMWMAGRWPRIAVTLGGLYATLLTAAVAALLAVSLPHGVLTALFWQLALLALYGVVLNLNPLMELDGYFLLMDWLERPNLRDRCLAWLGTELPAVLRGRDTLRGHRIELAYGVGAVLYVLFSTCMLLIVFRPVIEGWLGSVLPHVVASGIALALTGGMAALVLLGLINDVRAPRNSTQAR